MPVESTRSQNITMTWRRGASAEFPHRGTNGNRTSSYTESAASVDSMAKRQTGLRVAADKCKNKITFPSFVKMPN
jgi:hypothetical protein